MPSILDKLRAPISPRTSTPAGAGSVSGSTATVPPRAPTDAFTPGAAPADAAAPIPPDAAMVAAVNKMKELVGNGQLQGYYDAAIGQPSAISKDEAMKLFGALPRLDSTTTAGQLVNLGLWASEPRGIAEMLTSARYLPGRQVLCPAPVDADATHGNTNFLAYKEGGPVINTYRATLAGEQGDQFKVKIDGRDEPILVPKSTIFALNQPQRLRTDDQTFYADATEHLDFDSPFLKAKLAEAAIKTSAAAAQLDFTQMTKRSSGALVDSGEAMVETQKRCVKLIHDCINTRYANASSSSDPGRQEGGDIGRIAIKGQGHCFDQAAVMIAMLEPFREALGIDVQFISGHCYRSTRGPTDHRWADPGSSQDRHGWLQVSYRPFVDRFYVVDRTWTDVNLTADRAYSRYGDRFPTEMHRALKPDQVLATDVNMSGDVTVQEPTRQFGQAGIDGRTHHQADVDR